jgi:hypothetical protein
LGKQVTDSQVFKEMYFLQLQRVTRCRNYEWINVLDCYACAHAHTAHSIRSLGTLNHQAPSKINLVHPFKIPGINSPATQHSRAPTALLLSTAGHQQPCYSAQHPRTPESSTWMLWKIDQAPTTNWSLLHYIRTGNWGGEWMRDIDTLHTARWDSTRLLHLTSQHAVHSLYHYLTQRYPITVFLNTSFYNIFTITIVLHSSQTHYGPYNYISVVFSYLVRRVRSACVRTPPGSVIWAEEGQGWSVQSAVERHSIAVGFAESPVASAGTVAVNAGTPTGLLKQCYLKDPVPLQWRWVM